jgi:recombination protein RecA
VKVVKNKMAPPFREVEFDILYGQGISRSGDIIDLASELGIIEKSGAWFSFGSDRIGQGRENAKTYLEQHPEVLEKIETMVLAKHGIKRSAGLTTSPSPASSATTQSNGATEDRNKKSAVAPKPAN